MSKEIEPLIDKKELGDPFVYAAGIMVVWVFCVSVWLILDTPKKDKKSNNQRLPEPIAEVQEKSK